MGESRAVRSDDVFHHQIRELYAAFNRRDGSYVTDRMSPDVTWPRAFKGGVVHGHDAVRAYSSGKPTHARAGIELPIVVPDAGP